MSQAIVAQNEHRSLKYTATATLAIGDLLLLPPAVTARTAYVVDGAAVSGEDVTVITGPVVVNLASNSADAFGFGSQVWWDESAEECVNAKGVGNWTIGTCVNPAGVLSSATTMLVKLSGMPSLDNVDY